MADGSIVHKCEFHFLGDELILVLEDPNPGHMTPNRSSGQTE